MYLHEKLKSSYKIISIILITIFAIFLISSFSYEELASNRMLSFIITGEDGSVNTRKIQTIIGLESISKDYIFADYAGQYYTQHSFGSYMHNIISYYRQFGIFTFIFIILIFLKLSNIIYLGEKINLAKMLITSFISLYLLLLRVYFLNHTLLPIFGLYLECLVK